MRGVNLGALIISVTFILKTATNAQITFSEIMFDVSTNEYHDEFVELFNLSQTDSIDITSWQFSDSSGSDVILPLRGGAKIPPRSFAVILDGSYSGNSTSYDSIIPDTVLLLTISDNSFGKNGLSNSQPELLSIVDRAGDTLSTYRYSPGNIPGFSDEKMILDGENDKSNWSDSKTEGGTPGFTNSVTPPRLDLGFEESAMTLPQFVFEHESVQIEVTIKNYGLEQISDSVRLALFSDRNGNNFFDGKDVLHDERDIYISKGATLRTLKMNWYDAEAGEHVLIARLYYDKDQNGENDFVIKNVHILSSGLHLHINEIKFLTAPEEPEWIELINSGDKKIYLRGWYVADQKDTIVMDTSLFLTPGRMKVIAAGSLAPIYEIDDSLVIILEGFPNLNNTEDELMLFEPAGSLKERIHYNSDWLEGEQDRMVSLERINPNLYSNKAENWGPCLSTDGATPGRQNSIYTELAQKEGTISVAPNPFSPDGDGFEDIAIISAEIPETSARIKAQIFDIKGRMIRTLSENRFIGSRFNLLWDGKDQDGNRARIGIYIIFVQTLNDWQGVIRELKTTIVLAGEL
jgi:hypothetical protein